MFLSTSVMLKRSMISIGFFSESHVSQAGLYYRTAKCDGTSDPPLWQLGYGSAPSLGTFLRTWQALYRLSSVSSPAVIARFRFESVHNHWPLSSALGHDKCVTTRVLHVGPERSLPNHFSRVMLCSQHFFIVLFLVFLLYL